jgi:hypothetical protein
VRARLHARAVARCRATAAGYGNEGLGGGDDVHAAARPHALQRADEFATAERDYRQVAPGSREAGWVAGRGPVK